MEIWAPLSPTLACRATEPNSDPSGRREICLRSYSTTYRSNCSLPRVQSKTLWEASDAQAADTSPEVESLPGTNIPLMQDHYQKSAYHRRPTSRSLFSKYASSCSDRLIFICISRFCWKEENRRQCQQRIQAVRVICSTSKEYG